MVRMEFDVKSEVSQGTARCDEERQQAIEWKKRENKRRFKRQNLNMGRCRPSTESRRPLGNVVMGLFVYTLSMYSRRKFNDWQAGQK